MRASVIPSLTAGAVRHAAPALFRECVHCGREFLLLPGKPGRANECPMCSHDISLLTADSRGVVLAEPSADDEWERLMDRQGVGL